MERMMLIMGLAILSALQLVEAINLLTGNSNAAFFFGGAEILALTAVILAARNKGRVS